MTTAAFKKWFGDSKVVDSKGRPLVVYHGSPDVRGILKDGFRPSPSRGSAFFAALDYAMADSYADDRRAFDFQNAEPQTIPLYLSIQNPMIVDGKGQVWSNTKKHVEEARALGHDGLIILQTVDFYSNIPEAGKKRKKAPPPTTVFIWFKPSQAKSAITGQLLSRIDGKSLANATGNDGSFDADDPDIRSNPPVSDREEATYEWFELYDATLSSIWHEWLAARKKKPSARGRQTWSVISKSKLHRVWKSFAEFGFVRDEEALDDIANDVISNVVKIDVNTTLLGHTQNEPAIEIQYKIEEDMSVSEIERLLDGFGDFAVDEKGSLRISDYAMDKMKSGVVDIMLASDANKKIAAVDHVLNIVHQRSDLASWFVQGGSNSLTELSAAQQKGNPPKRLVSQIEKFLRKLDAGESE